MKLLLIIQLQAFKTITIIPFYRGHSEVPLSFTNLTGIFIIDNKNNINY